MLSVFIQSSQNSEFEIGNQITCQIRNKQRSDKCNLIDFESIANRIWFSLPLVLMIRFVVRASAFVWLPMTDVMIVCWTILVYLYKTEIHRNRLKFAEKCNKPPSYLSQKYPVFLAISSSSLMNHFRPCRSLLSWAIDAWSYKEHEHIRPALGVPRPSWRKIRYEQGIPVWIFDASPPLHYILLGLALPPWPW